MVAGGGRYALVCVEFTPAASALDSYRGVRVARGLPEEVWRVGRGAVKPTEELLSAANEVDTAVL